MVDSEILAEAKRRAPWFWPVDPWSVDLSCKQGQQRTIEQVKRERESAPSAGEADHGFSHPDNRHVLHDRLHLLSHLA